MAGRKTNVSAEQVLDLRKQGLTYKAIAKELGIGYSTVTRYLAKVQTRVKKKNANKEDMLALRAEGKTNKEIAEILGVHLTTVYNYIGKQHHEMTSNSATKANLAKAAKKEVSQPTPEPAPEPTPVVELEPVIEPEPIPEPAPVVTPEPSPTPAPAPIKKVTKRYNIPEDLFGFAYVPSWYDQLCTLSKLADREPWCFTRPETYRKNTETPILEFYIFSVFRSCATLYNTLPDEMAETILYMRGNMVCIHTGLYTSDYKGIYMLFYRNLRPGVSREWYFKGFKSSDSKDLYYISPLPRHYSVLAESAKVYHPEREIRINSGHILTNPENKSRLPGSLQDAWNLPLLLETAVEFARRKATFDPGIVAMSLYNEETQYLLPIHITNPDKPDLALTLEEVENIYYGHTCLTLEMAYTQARKRGRPTAKWLTALVEPGGGNTP